MNNIDTAIGSGSEFETKKLFIHVKHSKQPQGIPAERNINTESTVEFIYERDMRISNTDS